MTGRPHFSKRPRKTARDLRRRSPSREPYEVVLIACEGSKTEPQYFDDLRNHLGLRVMDVQFIRGETDPLRLVEQAIETAKRDGLYDRVFCVFDKDSHSTYKQAIDKISKVRTRFKVSAITSVPCFEFWLLLHYQCTDKPFKSAHGGSVCDEVIRELRKHLQGYNKAMPYIFELTSDLIDVAIRNARIVLRNVEAVGTDNPSTKVHELVLYMQKVKEQMESEV